MCYHYFVSDNVLLPLNICRRQYHVSGIHRMNLWFMVQKFSLLPGCALKDLKTAVLCQYLSLLANVLDIRDLNCNCVNRHYLVLNFGVKPQLFQLYFLHQTQCSFSLEVIVVVVQQCMSKFHALQGFSHQGFSMDVIGNASHPSTASRKLHLKAFVAYRDVWYSFCSSCVKFFNLG